MNNHVEPRFASALNAMFSPAAPSIATDTPPDEAARVRADIAYQRDKERLRQEHALALQLRYGDGQ